MIKAILDRQARWEYEHQRQAQKVFVSPEAIERLKSHVLAYFTYPPPPGAAGAVGVGGVDWYVDEMLTGHEARFE